MRSLKCFIQLVVRFIKFKSDVCMTNFDYQQKWTDLQISMANAHQTMTPYFCLIKKKQFYLVFLHVYIHVC